MIRELPFRELSDEEKAEIMWAWHLGLPLQFSAGAGDGDGDVYWHIDEDGRDDRTNAPDYYGNLIFRIAPPIP